jgi:uncharacterized protein
MSRILLELPMIREIAEQNEEEDFRFRNYIKGFRGSDKRLDEIVEVTTKVVWEQIDCLHCANCCKTMYIEVTQADSKRLAKRLEMTVKAFKE